MKLKFAIPLSLALLASLVRAPQIYDCNRPLDGDECVVAYMAIHDLNEKKVPAYFYGQSYGLSWVEFKAIAFISQYFGEVSTETVRIAMLALYSAAVFFFSYFLLLRFGISKGIWLAMLFICCPAWGIWSVKARGGYLTSLLFTSLSLALFERARTHLTWVHGLFFGLLLSIIYASHFLFLLIVFPILIHDILNQKNLKFYLFTVLSSIAGILLLSQLESPTDQHKVSSLSMEAYRWFVNMFKLIPSTAAMFENTSYLHDYISMNGLGKILGYLWSIPTIWLTLYFFKSFKKITFRSYLLWVMVSIFLLFLVNIASHRISFRYLLALPMLMIIALGYFNFFQLKYFRVFLSLFLVVNAYYIYSLKDFIQTDLFEHSIAQGIAEIRKAGNKNVIVNDERFAWELQFYTKDEFNVTVTDSLRSRYSIFKEMTHNALRDGKSVSRIDAHRSITRPYQVQFIPLADSIHPKFKIKTSQKKN